MTSNTDKIGFKLGFSGKNAGGIRSCDMAPKPAHLSSYRHLTKQLSTLLICEFISHSILNTARIQKYIQNLPHHVLRSRTTLRI